MLQDCSWVFSLAAPFPGVVSAVVPWAPAVCVLSSPESQAVCLPCSPMRLQLSPGVFLSRGISCQSLSLALPPTSLPLLSCAYVGCQCLGLTPAWAPSLHGPHPCTGPIPAWARGHRNPQGFCLSSHLCTAVSSPITSAAVASCLATSARSLNRFVVLPRHF